MHIITVIPLTRSKVAETLSYFTSEEIPLGAVVTVPLRSKTIHAIVIDTKPAEDMKSDIRNAAFEIRKLSKVKATIFFPPSFIETCKKLADYYASTPGSIINALVSDVILENVGKIAPPLPMQISFSSLNNQQAIFPSLVTTNRDDTYVIQGDDEDRISSWRSLIRQEFARKKSLVMYVSSVEDTNNLFRSLEKGVEGYIFLLNGNLTPKKVIETWKNISETVHPIVIIATSSFSVLPRNDIETVVIERENNRGWISARSPYLDLRHALETLARRQKQTVYRADSLVNTETLHRLDEHEIAEGSPFKWRSISNAKDVLIDMKVDPKSIVPTERPESEENDGKHAKNKEAIKPKFRILSVELENLIRKNHEDNTHLFILAIRRGLSSMTTCDDCGTIVTCRQCSAPVVLHVSKETGKNYFMCHKCGERRSANETCKVCLGWRLTPLGIGIDRVHEEVKNLFPECDLVKIDSDSNKTEKQIRESMDKFRAKPGSILLGTEIALLHLTDKVDNVAVVSLDSLFALPDFRIQEKIMYTLIRLRTMATKNILVQTRRSEEKVFEFGLKGNLSDFYRGTLKEREQFRYPPFATLIKITLEGNKDGIAAEMSTIQELIEPYEIDIFPAFTSTVRGNSVIHGLIKVESSKWPDMELVNKLRSLPPYISVRINPESLL